MNLWPQKAPKRLKIQNNFMLYWVGIIEWQIKVANVLGDTFNRGVFFKKVTTTIKKLA